MKYTISILTMCALEQARRCIASVFEHSKDFKLILTSNGSPEAAKMFRDLERIHPNVRVVVNAKNEGFIEPSRKAFEMCDTPYLVLLNDDALACPNWLELLSAPLDKDPMAALSGPVGGCRTLHGDFTGYAGKTLDFIEGSCLMVKTALVKPHGLFAPELVGAYGEDSYLSLRMRELGYSIHQVGFKLQHERATTSKHVPEVKDWHANNVAFLARRFRHYMAVRRFDYPIVLRRTGAYGDVLLLTPVIRALRQQHPLCPIYVETRCAEVFSGNPMVKQAAKSIPRMKHELRVNLDGAYETRLDRHIVDAYAVVCGVKVDDFKPDVFPTATKIEMPDRACVLHSGPVSWPGKTWPIGNWHELANEIYNRTDFNIVWVGASYFQTAVGLNLTGKTTIHELSSVIARAKMFIGVDSYPSHVAASLDIPSVVLFGITSPQFITANAEKTIAVCSDPSHPFTGYRHKVSNVEFVACDSNPLETVTVDMVMKAIKML